MTERPILFSAPMVRAILEGRKTCTRRVLKPQPSIQATKIGPCRFTNSGLSEWTGETSCMCAEVKIPQQIGDKLWVREAWRVETGDRNHVAPRDLPSDTKILFDADADWKNNTRVGKLRPSMFMCRWMSRITLRVTSIKIERLRDISEADARAEGAWHWKDTWDQAQVIDDARDAFCHLWESINGPGSWDANPWVAAIGFEVVK